MTLRRHRRPPIVGLLAVALVLALSATWGGSASPAAAQTSPPEDPSLTLVEQTAWVGPEGTYRVTVRAEGLPTGSTVGAVLHARVRSRAALAAVFDDDVFGLTAYDMLRLPLSEVDPEGDGTFTLTLPEAAELDAAPGMYPFVIQVYGADGGELTRLTTTLLRLGPATTRATPLSVAVVVPVQAPAAPGPDGTPVLDEADVAELTVTLDTADQSGVPLSFSPSPETVQVLSTSGTATDLLETLRPSASRQVLSGPYAPIDSGAWTASGLIAEMDDQYTTGTTILQALLGSRPSERTAVLDRTVTPEALDRLRANGVETVVVPSNQLTPLAGSASTSTFASQFEVGTAADATVRAVVGDDVTSTRLAAGDDPVLAGHRALAELAYLHLADADPARGVAVVVPPSTDPVALATFLGGLAATDGTASGSPGAPMLAPTTLDELFRSTAPDTTSGSRSGTLVRSYEFDPPADLGRYPAELVSARASLAGLRSLVPTASELTFPIGLTLLSSGARYLDPADRDEMVDTTETTIADTAAGIVVTPEQIVTLTSSSGNVPLNLENRLSYEATVRIVMASAKLDFPEGSVIETTIPAAQTTTISLPVETRASGAFPLTVEITSTDGELPVATTRYTVRSTAISGVGLVISLGAGLFLLVWWARHFRTTRRARKLVAATHPALSGSGPYGYAPPDPDPLEGP